MKQPASAMPPTTFSQMSVYCLACRQLPNVQMPAIGTTESSIPNATITRIW